MKIKELITELQRYDPNLPVTIRYETKVRYSDLTSGPEDVLRKLDETAIIGLTDQLILAADLCEE